MNKLNDALQNCNISPDSIVSYPNKNMNPIPNDLARGVMIYGNRIEFQQKFIVDINFRQNVMIREDYDNAIEFIRKYVSDSDEKIKDDEYLLRIISIFAADRAVNAQSIDKQN